MLDSESQATQRRINHARLGESSYTTSHQSCSTRRVKLHNVTAALIRWLRQDFFDHVAMHIGQTEIAAGVAVGQPLVVESHLVQHRGVKIVQRDFVLGHRHRQFVGCSVSHPAAEAAAGQPDRVAIDVMIAPDFDSDS